MRLSEINTSFEYSVCEARVKLGVLFFSYRHLGLVEETLVESVRFQFGQVSGVDLYYRICVKLGSEALLGGPFCVLVSFKEGEQACGGFSLGSAFANFGDQVKSHSISSWANLIHQSWRGRPPVF